MGLLKAAVIGVIILAGTPAYAAQIIYSVNTAVGTVGSISGTITTDGTIGTIVASNIVGYNLDVFGNGAQITVNTTNSSVFVGGNSLTASGSQLTFNFGNSNPSYLLFQESFGTGTKFACAASTPAFSTPCYQGLSAVPLSYNDSTAQYTGQGSGGVLTGNLQIGSAVPEPATWSMMLLGFCMVGFGLRSRRKSNVRVTYA